MSVEISVYTTEKPLSGAELMALAANRGLELRLVVPIRCVTPSTEELAKPLKKQDLMVYCWPKSDTQTTAVLDKALHTGDQSLILSVQNQMGWFNFHCEKYDYAKFWGRYPDEQKEFEDSVSTEVLRRMRASKVRYFFRCGLRPKQNTVYLGKIAELVRDATSGYLGE
jgi:hypothetical protein